MKTLWGNSTVQNILHDQNVRLEEMAGFFLDSLDEVTEERYIPSNGELISLDTSNADSRGGQIIFFVQD